MNPHLVNAEIHKLDAPWSAEMLRWNGALLNAAAAENVASLPAGHRTRILLSLARLGAQDEKELKDDIINMKNALDSVSDKSNQELQWTTHIKQLKNENASSRVYDSVVSSACDGLVDDNLPVLCDLRPAVFPLDHVFTTTVDNNASTAPVHLTVKTPLNLAIAMKNTSGSGSRDALKTSMFSSSGSSSSSSSGFKKKKPNDSLPSFLQSSKPVKKKPVQSAMKPKRSMVLADDEIVDEAAQAAQLKERARMDKELKALARAAKRRQKEKEKKEAAAAKDGKTAVTKPIVSKKKTTVTGKKRKAPDAKSTKTVDELFDNNNVNPARMAMLKKAEINLKSSGADRPHDQA